MNRLLLTLLLGVLFAATTFGWDLSLAPGLSVKNGFIYVIMFIYLIQMAVSGGRGTPVPSVIVIFGLLVGYSILSWFVTGFVVQPSYYDVLEAGISLKSLQLDNIIVFLLFYYGLNSKEDALRLARVFLWIVVAGNLLTVVDGFNIPDLGIIQQREDGRLGGPMGESNQYGAFLALTLPAVLALRFDPRTRKWFATVAALISVLALLATGSRGAFVGLIAGASFALFFLRDYVSMRQVAIALSITIGALALIVAIGVTTDLFSSVFERVWASLSGNADQVSSGRSDIWKTAIDRMLLFPLSLVLGYGWDSYNHMRFEWNTHNYYLNIWYNLGVPGLLLYLSLIYSLFLTCRRALRGAAGIARAHLMAFVFGFASMCASVAFVELYAPWLYIWSYTGIVIRLAVLTMQEKNEESGKGSSQMSDAVVA
jgi:O-antigen ligase